MTVAESSVNNLADVVHTYNTDKTLFLDVCVNVMNYKQSQVARNGSMTVICSLAAPGESGWCLE